MIKDLVSSALGMPLIYAEIGIPGPFMDELKRLWLSGHGSVVLPSWKQVGRLLSILKAHPQLAEQGRWHFGRLPKVPLLERAPGTPYAIHELFLIKEFLFHYGKLQLFGIRESLFDKALPDLDQIFKRLDPEGSASPSFRLGPAFSPILAKLSHQRQVLASSLEQARQAHFELACSRLKLKALSHEFVVARSERELCSRLSRGTHFALVGESVANLRFKLADDAASLKLLRKLDKLDRQLRAEEARVLLKLGTWLDRKLPLIRKAVQVLNAQALLFMLAEFGLRHHCVVPSFGKSGIRIKSAVNLPLKLHLMAQNRRYQPIDLEFEARGNLITGPNMGGKSCALQTLGQLARLAQLRVPLPCESAVLPPFDFIWLNQDDSSRGADLSAFGREVVSFCEALSLPGRGLILLDEFARGTNPAEGEALLCAILRYLRGSGHLAVAATHFSAPALMKELAQFAITGPDLKQLQMDGAAVSHPEQRLKMLSQRMDYSLKRVARGQLPPHSAIGIARLLGLPDEILKLIKGETEQ